MVEQITRLRGVLCARRELEFCVRGVSYLKKSEIPRDFGSQNSAQALQTPQLPSGSVGCTPEHAEPPRSQDASACGCGMTKGTRCTPFRQTTRAPSACGCSPRGVRAGSPPKLVRIPHQDTDHLLSLPRGAFFGLYRGKYPGNSFEIVNSAFSLPRGAFFTFVSYHSICAQCTVRRLGPAPRRPPRS